jgi:hypothetical protein
MSLLEAASVARFAWSRNYCKTLTAKDAKDAKEKTTAAATFFAVPLRPLRPWR